MTGAALSLGWQVTPQKYSVTQGRRVCEPDTGIPSQGDEALGKPTGLSRPQWRRPEVMHGAVQDPSIIPKSSKNLFLIKLPAVAAGITNVTARERLRT